MWYDKNTSTRLNKLPTSVKCAQKGWLLNFNERDTSEIIEQGYVPLTDNVPTYDSAKETISQSGIVVAGDGNSATIEYAVSDKSLDDLKAAKKSQVDAYYRDYSAPHRLVTFTKAGSDHVALCDSTTILNLSGIATAYERGLLSHLEPVTWKFDGLKSTNGTITHCELYDADVTDFQKILIVRDQGVRDKRQDHKNQIDALTNADDIVNYDHTAGWPS